MPWSSPVWFATDDHRELYWVSHPEAHHSRNIAVRPQIALVVFDSTVAPGHGQAVYMTATASQLTDAQEIERGLAVFSGEAVRQGIGLMGAYKTVERKLGDRTFLHCGSELLNWCVGNARVVLTTLREAVGDDEFFDVTVQLPDDYISALAALRA